jgi:hypothetical protein
MQPLSQIRTPLELYKHLPRTNCGRCGCSTCLAFAAAVIRSEKRLSDCPFLDEKTAGRIDSAIRRQVNLDSIRDEQLSALKKKLSGVDILSRAEALGARRSGGWIVVPCLGKDFELDLKGGLASQCHTHAWFSLPFLDYVLHSRGVAPSGRWVPFRELKHGRTWNPLFEQRCEKPLKRLADAYSDLFADLVGMFSGISSSDLFDADVSVVLQPFPKVPLLICYWRPEDGMDSKLHLFFDDTAEENLSIESLFTVGTGIARMLERIMHTHSGGKSELS